MAPSRRLLSYDNTSIEIENNVAVGAAAVNRVLDGNTDRMIKRTSIDPNSKPKGGLSDFAKDKVSDGAVAVNRFTAVNRFLGDHVCPPLAKLYKLVQRRSTFLVVVADKEIRLDWGFFRRGRLRQ
jgi:hypothetical protein